MIVLHEVLALTVTKITQFVTFTLYFHENGDIGLKLINNTY